MKRNEYRIVFKAADGITFFAYHSGECESDAIRDLLNDVDQNGCLPFFPQARTVEEIESITCAY